MTPDEIDALANLINTYNDPSLGQFSAAALKPGDKILGPAPELLTPGWWFRKSWFWYWYPVTESEAADLMSMRCEGDRLVKVEAAPVAVKVLVAD